MMHLAEHWEIFATLVVPADAPDVQRQEMRRAFYAGAQSALVFVASAAFDDEDEAVELLEGLHRELNEFGKEVAAGRA